MMHSKKVRPFDNVFLFINSSFKWLIIHNNTGDANTFLFPREASKKAALSGGHFKFQKIIQGLLKINT